MTYEEHAWDAYVAANEAFAQRIAAEYQEGDMVWIHDYHLLLVPQMLRRMVPDAHIGLFVHAPFPSSEIFRCLPRECTDARCDKMRTYCGRADAPLRELQSAARS